MSLFKTLFTGCFVVLGTIWFLRLVGQEVQIQQRALELEKWRREEEARVRDITLLVARPAQSPAKPTM